jgi:hypothetical protein
MVQWRTHVRIQRQILWTYLESYGNMWCTGRKGEILWTLLYNRPAGFFNCIRSTDINEWRERKNKHNATVYDEKFDKIFKIKNIKLQRDFSEDNKRIIRKMTIEQFPICKIPSQQVEDFEKGRWEQYTNVDQDKVSIRFPIKKFCNKEMLNDLFSKDKMRALISKKKVTFQHQD